MAEATIHRLPVSTPVINGVETLARECARVSSELQASLNCETSMQEHARCFAEVYEVVERAFVAIGTLQPELVRASLDEIAAIKLKVAA